jgi:glycerol-3-phosphate O-acyltransferase
MTTPHPTLATARRYRSTMRRKFGLLFHLSGIGILLRRMRLEDHSTEEIRRAAERGPVVYILHSRSALDWLALNRALNGRRLPLARFTNGMRSTQWAPLQVAIAEWWNAIKGWFSTGSLPEPTTSGWLTNVVAAGMPTALFLLEGRTLRRSIRPGQNRTKTFDPIPALLAAQAKSKEPIQVVPVVVAWQRRPEVARSQVAQFILGSQDEPGPLQKLLSVATRNAKAVVQAGAPIDLSEVLEKWEDESEDRKARRVRLLLRRYLWRESHLIRGPRIRPHRWTRRLVMQSPEVRKLVADESTRTGKASASIENDVEKVLDNLAAKMRIGSVRMVAWVLKFLWNRIYAGVDLPDEDMRRLRESFRDATPVLIPCHRSHLDYLLVSSQLFYRDMVIPHVVAGENLSFFPAGPILRRCGAFFIKRKFGEDNIFPVVFERYLHQLIRDGFPIEFFIEGGRSRTGKLLPPRLGVLRMIMNSAQHLREGWDINLVPIGISYEQIAEEKTYRRELQGEDKVTENMGQVVKATSIFKRRFGRVYVRVGEPIRLSEVFAKHAEPFTELDHNLQEEMIQHTGECVMHGIGKRMVVMPSGLVALALLAQSRRGIRVEALHTRVDRMYKALIRAEAPIAITITEGAWGVREVLERFEANKLVQHVQADGEPIIQLIDDRRITLEYYKNGVLHHLVPMSLMAAAIRSQREAFHDGAVVAHDSEEADEVFRLFAEQVFLLRYEFTLDPETDIVALKDAALADLQAYGAINSDASGMGLLDKEAVIELAELTRNLLESIILTLRGARAMRTRDLNSQTMATALQELGAQLINVDDLKRPEALSIVNLKNAIRSFKDEGILSFRTDGNGLELDDVAIDEHAADLDRLLA